MTTATFQDCYGTYEMKIASKRSSRGVVFSWVAAVAGSCVTTGLVNRFSSETAAICAAKRHVGFSNVVVA